MPLLLLPFSALLAIRVLGDSLECLREFPADARHDARYQPDRVQRGKRAHDFKPTPAIGKGVEEMTLPPSGVLHNHSVTRLTRAGTARSRASSIRSALTGPIARTLEFTLVG